MFDRKSFPFFVCFLPALALADGFPGIFGKTKDGLHIAIGEHYETTVDIETWRDSKKGPISILNYKNEPCVLTYEPKNQIVCSSEGKSPLAGTKYIGRAAKGSCEGGSPEFIYTCITGCGKNSHAPRTLTKDYWEC